MIQGEFTSNVRIQSVTPRQVLPCRTKPCFILKINMVKVIFTVNVTVISNARLNGINNTFLDLLIFLRADSIDITVGSHDKN